jgi:predicted transcriptional regulator
MRTLITIDEKDIRALDDLASADRVSRAELIRQAVHDLLSRRKQLAAGDAFGLWGDEAKDGLVYEQELREEW